jgi:cell division protein FtsW
MSNGKINIEGDKGIWGILLIIMLGSFLSVYSASANLAFVYGKVSVGQILGKHAMFLIVGLGLIYVVHRMPHKYFGPISVLGIVISIVLLIFTLRSGQQIDGANASRWLRVPFLGISLQTSAFAGLVLLLYIARTLSKRHAHEWTLKNSWVIYVPMGLVLVLIFPANFSTAALLFFSCALVLFVGKYPLKYIASMVGAGVVLAGLFVLTVTMMPNMSNRVDTWKSRISNFSSSEATDNYQVSKAKMAISNGGVIGQGPGKSVQKNFLPQSTSDFIYAIIVEEYGLVGGFSVIILYLMLWIRIVRIAQRATTYFGSLAAFAAGFALIFQAFVNMSVAVNIFPVTGQTLPLLSAGGSSIWVSCMALGVILSISRDTKRAAAESNGNTDESPGEEHPLTPVSP